MLTKEDLYWLKLDLEKDKPTIVVEIPANASRGLDEAVPLEWSGSTIPAVGTTLSFPSGLHTFWGTIKNVVLIVESIAHEITPNKTTVRLFCKWS